MSLVYDSGDCWIRGERGGEESDKGVDDCGACAVPELVDGACDVAKCGCC